MTTHTQDTQEVVRNLQETYERLTTIYDDLVDSNDNTRAYISVDRALRQITNALQRLSPGTL